MWKLGNELLSEPLSIDFVSIVVKMIQNTEPQNRSNLSFSHFQIKFS